MRSDISALTHSQVVATQCFFIGGKKMFPDVENSFPDHLELLFSVPVF